MAKVDRGYHNRATSRQVYPDITPNAPSSELFLPAYLRLGPTNWLEFKLAIETIFRVKSLPLTHLTHSECPRLLAADKEQGEKWAADDQLCKAIILLNVRSDHFPFAELEHEQWTTAEVWEMLVERDLMIRTGVRERWRWLMRVYRFLLGVACILLFLMVIETRKDCLNAERSSMYCSGPVGGSQARVVL